MSGASLPPAPRYAGEAPASAACPPEVFWMSTSKMPRSSSIPRRRLPVRLHQDMASRAKPGSVERTLSATPSATLSIFPFRRMMGPGHCRPQASMRIVSEERAAMASGMPEPSAYATGSATAFPNPCVPVRNWSSFV